MASNPQNNKSCVPLTPGSGNAPQTVVTPVQPPFVQPTAPTPLPPQNTTPLPDSGGSTGNNLIYCPPSSGWQNCSPWDMSQDQSQCFIENTIIERVQIAGANIHIYRLLGVHEQTKLVDLTGNGYAISGGNYPGFPADNAFTKTKQVWKSCQLGAGPIMRSRYIGYDFGIVRVPNGRQRYSIDASIRQLIDTIRIKQSSNPKERVTKVRVERSPDGKLWYGVAVINLPDNDVLNTISFKQSVPSRYWRLRPLNFTGTNSNPWTIQALQLIEYQATQYNNIQDMILLENRDRSYAKQFINVKGYYELVDIATELSRFGIQIPSAIYSIRIPFSTVVRSIGRPIIIGDIIELPSEVQYTPQLTPVRRFLEVTDVTWDVTTYTPGWRPTMLKIVAQPAYASQETQDIFGDLDAKVIDKSGLLNNDDGNNPNWQDYSAVSQTIVAEAYNNVPERGASASTVVRAFTDEEIAEAASKGINITKIGLNPRGLYTEDAMPPNDLPYTEGPAFPDNPKNGDYHRLTYEGMASKVSPTLWRYSTIKGRWIYLETDFRYMFNQQKEILQDFIDSPTRVANKDIGKRGQ